MAWHAPIIPRFATPCQILPAARAHVKVSKPSSVNARSIQNHTDPYSPCSEVRDVLELFDHLGRPLHTYYRFDDDMLFETIDGELWFQSSICAVLGKHKDESLHPTMSFIAGVCCEQCHFAANDEHQLRAICKSVCAIDRLTMLEKRRFGRVGDDSSFLQVWLGRSYCRTELDEDVDVSFLRTPKFSPLSKQDIAACFASEMQHELLEVQKFFMQQGKRVSSAMELIVETKLKRIIILPPSQEDLPLFPRGFSCFLFCSLCYGHSVEDDWG